MIPGRVSFASPFAMPTDSHTHTHTCTEPCCHQWWVHLKWLIKKKKKKGHVASECGLARGCVKVWNSVNSTERNRWWFEMFEFALFLRYDLNSLSLKLSERVPKKMCVCFWRILLNSQQLEKKVQLLVKKIHFVFILTILSSIVMTLSLFYGTILFFTGHFYREKKNCSLPNHYSCVILSCQAFARHAEANARPWHYFTIQPL